ncbi:MAG: phytanoyl-CoA dioxygenase family protein [Ferruginibacter sp.]|nr:phytanoyl-CoA dioxygenase family protein [Ferruginibacter sp.]
MSSTNLSEEQLQQFNKDGYLIIKEFCSKPEVDKLYSTATRDKHNPGNALDLNGRPYKKTIPSWFTPGNDVFGYLERSEKIVSSVAQLLESDSPVCHIHSKLMEKVPHIGGVWEWHQDYAYWATNKFRSPGQMVSVMVALTPINKENGCSQVIKGSHKSGSIKHCFEGERVGAEMEAVDKALKTMELVYPELEAGDVLFFHSNLLHRSKANLGEGSSWSNISCYSSQSNLSQKQIFTSWQTPVAVLPNEAILQWEPSILPESANVYNDNTPSWKGIRWGQLVAAS